MKARIYIFLYAIAVLFISRVLPEDWFFIKSILGLPIIFILPYLFGRTIFLKIFNSVESFSNTSKILFYWLSGFTVWIFLFYIFSAFSIFNFAALTLVLYASAFLGLIIEFTKRGNTTSVVNLSSKSLVSILVILIFSLLLASYFRSLSPFPLQSGNDNIFLSGLSNELLQNDLSNSNFHIYSYLPYIPSFLGLGGIVANVEPIHILWFMPYVLYSLLGTGLFVFLYKKAQSHFISVITSVLFIFIFGFQGRLIDLINFREKNFFLVLLPFFLLFLTEVIAHIKEKKEKTSIAFLSLLIPATITSFSILYVKISFSILTVILILVFSVWLFLKKQFPSAAAPLLAILSLWSVLIHAYSGMFAVLLFCTLVFFWDLGAYNKYFQRLAVFLVYGLTILFVIFFSIGTVPTFLNPSMSDGGLVFGGQYNYDAQTKIDFLSSSLGIPLLIFSLLGVALSINTSFRTHIPYVSAFFASIILLFAPINFSYRLIELLIPFLAFFVSITLVHIKKIFNIHLSVINKLIVLSVVAILFISIVPKPVEYINWIFGTSVADSRVGFTNFTKAEYEASRWIKENYPQNTLIFTSPELTRSVTALSAKTIMLQSSVYEYQYRAHFSRENNLSTCRNILLNGYPLSSRSVIHENGETEFLVDTVDKYLYENKLNTITINNCRKETVSRLVLEANNFSFEVEPRQFEDKVVYEFVDADQAKKDYTLAIFDTVSDLRELRREIFESKDAELAYKKALLLQMYYYEGLPETKKAEYSELHSLVFVSGPVASWSDSAADVNRLSAEFENFSGFPKFASEQYFTLVFSIPNEVYVYELVQ